MARNDPSPVIAITGPTRGGTAPRAFIDLGVRLAGGRPLHLSPAAPRKTRDMNGVVISGGHDVDPVLYAESPKVRPRYDPERDAFESMVINEALERNLPLLGICRGAQLLNVCMGGTLHQELSRRRQRTSNRRTILALKTIDVADGSRLQQLLHTRRLRVNSLHDQGIDRLGDGLRVVAEDLDSIVQAVEARDRDFLLGVQWHPEFLLYSARQRRLFRGLVDAARVQAAHSERRTEKPTESAPAASRVPETGGE